MSLILRPFARNHHNFVNSCTRHIFIQSNKTPFAYLVQRLPLVSVPITGSLYLCNSGRPSTDLPRMWKKRAKPPPNVASGGTASTNSVQLTCQSYLLSFPQFTLCDVASNSWLCRFELWLVVVAERLRHHLIQVLL